MREVEANDLITSVAGDGIAEFAGDNGLSTNASLFTPAGVAVDAYGDIFIADTHNNRIREATPNGVISTVAGGGTTNASLNQPKSVSVDNYGDLFIADTGNSRVREVVFQGPTLILKNTGPGNAGSYNVVVTGPTGSVTSSVVSLAVSLPPQNLSAAVSANQRVQFQLTGTPGSGYVLLSTTNLAPPIVWQPIVTNYADTNGNWTFTDTNALNVPFQFYRAMLP